MNTEEAEIDLMEVLRSIKKNLVLIILLMVVLGAGAFCYAKFVMKPIYEAKVLMIVNTRADPNATLITGDNINSATKMIDTYAVVIKQGKILPKVIENLDLDMTPEELSKNLSITSVNSSQVLQILLTNPDVELAGKIVNEIKDVAPDEIVAAVNAGSCVPVSDVKIGTTPVSPSKTKYAALGAFAGLAIGVVIAIIKMLLHNTIIDDEDVKKYLDIPILGVIPEISEEYHA